MINDFKMLDAVFFEEEIREGYLVSPQMKKVWACELDLLNQLLAVCEKYHLKCWADSGTLIGAVRHKGFIPWDDDIDMVMLREDYDKLVQVADKEFKAPSFFQTVYSDKYYGNRHAQIRNSDTAAIAHSKVKCNQGIFIDIFVFDGVPDVPRLLQKHLSRVKCYKQFLKFTSKVLWHLPETLYDRLRWDSRIYEKYEEVLRSVPISETELMAHLSLNYKVRIKNRSFYDRTEYLDFENIKIPVPAEYDAVLRIDFGDYMTPVQSPTLHGTLLFDAEQSYKEVLKQMRQGSIN